MNDKDRKEVLALAESYRKSRAEFLKAAAAVRLKVDQLLAAEQKKLGNMNVGLQSTPDGTQILDSSEVLRRLAGELPREESVADPDFEELVGLEITPERLSRGILPPEALEKLPMTSVLPEHDT